MKTLPLNMKTINVLIAVFLLSATLVQAQNISVSGVVRMRLKSSGPILSGDQVKGYYFFHSMEKVDKKNNNYMLSVYDENLRKINSVNIVRSTKFALVDGAFNGEVFAFLFYDLKTRTTELLAYDRTLKEVGSLKKPVVSKYELAVYNAVAEGASAGQAFLVPISQQGFLYYGLQAASKQLYKIHYFDNTLKERWSMLAPESSYGIEIASEGFQTEQYLGSLITKKKSASSKDIDVDLMVQSAADGEMLFQVPLESGPYSISFSDVFFDDVNQNFVVFGEYYDKTEKELKAQSLGFIYLTLDLKGDIVGEKTNSWAGEISRVTPMNANGKVEGSNTSILVHDIIRTSDGQIFVVGEQYKKAASGAGIALNVLSVAAAAAGGGYYSASSSVQLNVYNLVIFQFNPDYSINKMHIFEKDKNVVMLPAGSTYSSSKMLSYYARAVGGFDFVFSQMSEDRSTFSVAYINYDRDKNQPAGNLLGVVVYTPEKVFSVDKMRLSRKSSEYFVHRGKEGYVLITEYFRKEKRADSRLEKINF